ncbi:UNVERIFIED_CONTAM: hypothetical protein RMT77_002723 [Armadillidium vulgare]
MPFASLFKRDKNSSKTDSPYSHLSNKEKKSLFGLKVVQAQQNPEPVYDLSGCGASELPDDTYTFCKILGKTSLILKDNHLTSLDTGGSIRDLSELRFLDASFNKIEKLTDNICFLKKLQVLNLSNNKLRSLPDSFNSLLCLEELLLSDNKFSKVPPVVCALPKLRILSLKGNNINAIPEEISKLHNTLQSLELNFDIIENVNQDILKDGFTEIMKYFCNLEGFEYEGPKNLPDTDDVDSNAKGHKVSIMPVSPVDDIMVEYMKKKQQQLRDQILEEERMRGLENERLECVFQNTAKSKEELLQELTSSPFELADYELKKQEKVLEHMKLEENFRSEQNEQLDKYLNNFSNKESLLKDISANEDNFQLEVEAIVAAKEYVRLKLINDLAKSEEKTNAALQELLNLQQSQKSQDFVNLITEQEEEIKKTLSGLIEVSTEIRRADVLKAMKDSLLEVAMTEAEKTKIDEKHKSWVSTLMKEGQLEEEKLELLLNNKVVIQESFLSNILKEEEFQAEAFKLLLLKMDLKRNSVIRQIALIEYELTRLSSLELRTKQFGIKESSDPMCNQRKTLVDLLESLFKARDERDQELDSWVSQMSESKSPDLTSEDYWLLQYQRLMTLKPAGITESEEELDPKIYKILSMACALDLVPVFAKRKIDYNYLLDMTEEDFASIDIGSATYHSIQRALHSYLSSTKLEHSEPSAPEDDNIASAPPFPNDQAIGSVDFSPENSASAPPLEASYVETECVVCLSSDCRVLFIPCGHVCVCSSCCQPLTICPLCRSEIVNKYFIEAI